jgi:transposase
MAARAGNLDYHIEAHDFLYSVPHALIRAEVDVRITARTVEIFHRGQRVGVHQRRYLGRKHGTDPDHMPSSHRRYAEWTPEKHAPGSPSCVIQPASRTSTIRALAGSTAHSSLSSLLATGSPSAAISS